MLVVVVACSTIAACANLDGLAGDPTDASAGDGDGAHTDAPAACACPTGTWCTDDAGCALPARARCSSAFAIPEAGTYAFTICADAGLAAFPCQDGAVPAAFFTVPASPTTKPLFYTIHTAGQVVGEVGDDCTLVAQCKVTNQGFGGNIGGGHLIGVGALLDGGGCAPFSLTIVPN